MKILNVIAKRKRPIITPPAPQSSTGASPRRPHSFMLMTNELPLTKLSVTDVPTSTRIVIVFCFPPAIWTVSVHRPSPSVDSTFGVAAAEVERVGGASMGMCAPRTSEMAGDVSTGGGRGPGLSRVALRRSASATCSASASSAARERRCELFAPAPCGGLSLLSVLAKVARVCAGMLAASWLAPSRSRSGGTFG